MDEIILSIIVPVYNVEKFLRKCVESLEQQDLAQNLYEVILINDGSTDHCREICQELAGQYDNIQVIHQENQGVSTARNKGMDAAKGKYIMFVDPDDYIEPNIVGRVVDVAEKNKTELCFYLSEHFNEMNTWKGARQPFEYCKIYTGEYILLHGMEVSSVWSNLYLSDFLRRSGIRFHKGIIHQDVDFNLMLYPLTHRIMFTDILVYHYNRSLSYSSAIKNKDVAKHRKALMSDIEVVNDIFRYCWTASVSKAIKRLYRRRMRSTLVSAILMAYKDHRYYDNVFRQTLLDKAHGYHLYPIWGRTESWKTTIILPFINMLRFLHRVDLKIINNLFEWK